MDVSFADAGYSVIINHRSFGQQTIWATVNWATNQLGDNHLGDTFQSTGRQNFETLFFNRDSAETKGSASDIQGFCRIEPRNGN